jgi:hypothetical protein
MYFWRERVKVRLLLVYLPTQDFDLNVLAYTKSKKKIVRKGRKSQESLFGKHTTLNRPKICIFGFKR